MHTRMYLNTSVSKNAVDSEQAIKRKLLNILEIRPPGFTCNLGI